MGLGVHRKTKEGVGGKKKPEGKSEGGSETKNPELQKKKRGRFYPHRAEKGGGDIGGGSKNRGKTIGTPGRPD